VMQNAQAKMDAAVQAKLIRRSARIARVSAAQKPVIDGNLNDALYAQMKPLETFVGYVNPTGDPVALQATTMAWATYDDENLYVAFRNNEPAMSSLKVAGTSRDSAVWN